MKAMRVAAALVLTSGCSFALVRGPSERVSILPASDRDLKCTDSTLFPSLDALAGAAAAAVAGGGIVIEQTSDANDKKLENFTKYYAGPIVVGAIVYFVSAGFGNKRVTWCSDAHERMIKAQSEIRPIDPTPVKGSKPQQNDREDPLK